MADSVASTEPTQGYLRSMYDGAIEGDFSSNPSAAKTASQIGIGLIPVAGQIADARDTTAAVREIWRGNSRGWANLGFALVGWVPAAGDFVKSARRVGVRATLNSIGEAASSVKRTWSALWRTNDDRMGEVSGLIYRPGTNMSSDALYPGTLGITNRYGDIEVREGLDAATTKSTFDHESVHRFFSPKILFGQEFRANLGLLGYMESHLLRRTEEGLAEAWARFKRDGLSGVPEGWRFPYDHGYGIDAERLKVERNLLIGMGVSTMSAGSEASDLIIGTGNGERQK